MARLRSIDEPAGEFVWPSAALGFRLQFSPIYKARSCAYESFRLLALSPPAMLMPIAQLV
jgi:hypothetical protein